MYEEPATEFVARFIGSMNIVEGVVRREQVQVGSLEFPAPGFSDGQKLQVGFRPYYVKVAEDPVDTVSRPSYAIFIFRVAYRLEIETSDGLILRSRMNKEEFRRCNFHRGASRFICRHAFPHPAARRRRPPSIEAKTRQPYHWATDAVAGIASAGAKPSRSNRRIVPTLTTSTHRATGIGAFSRDRHTARGKSHMNQGRRLASFFSFTMRMVGTDLFVQKSRRSHKCSRESSCPVNAEPVLTPHMRACDSPS